ncbi:hypothetical protein Tco_0583341 [Tanacetum coccineum]
MRVVVMMMTVVMGCGCRRGGREKWRVEESGSGDRVDPEVGSVFGVGRKNPAGKLFRRWWHGGDGGFGGRCSWRGERGKVIEEFNTRDDELDTGIDNYPSYWDYDKKINIDYDHNLKFSCMIGFEFTHANFFPLLYVNVMSKEFHNSIIKDKMVYKGNNVVGALMNVPIFVGTFFVVTDFAVLEDMDAYRDEGMGDVIFGEPFLREVGIKARRFKRMITIYNGNC